MIKRVADIANSPFTFSDRKRLSERTGTESLVTC